MSTVSTEKMMAQIACKAIDDKKGQDIKVIDIHNVSVIADYFVIASGNSSTQTKTLAEEVEYQLSLEGIEPERKEGFNGSNWIILDYGDVVVHVFYKETRDYYQLERLWSDGERIDIEEFVTED